MTAAARSTRWTPRTIAQRAREVLHEEGARTLAFRVLAQSGYRRLAIYERSLFNPLPEREANSARGELVVVEEDRLEEYLAFRPDSDAAELRARLQAGHRCFASRLDGRLVSARWSARGRLRVDYLACELRLAGDEELGYDLYTAPDYRRRGIALTQRLQLLPALREEGLRRSLENPRPDNRAAIRLLEKTGYRIVGVIGFVGLGRRRRYFRRKLANGRLPECIPTGGRRGGDG